MHMQLRHVTVRTLYIDFQFELLQLELITGCGLGAIWDCHLIGRLSMGYRSIADAHRAGAGAGAGA